MTPECWDQVQEVVGWRLKRWRGHPDFQDMRQEALLRAWQVVEASTGRFKLVTLAARAADYAAIDFVRSARATLRMKRPGVAPDPPSVSWEQVLAWQTEREQPAPDQRGWLPCSPDFAPAILEQFATAALAAHLLGQCSQREQVVLRRYYYQEQTLREIGRDLGICAERVHQILHGALDRLRGRVLCLPPL